MKLYVDNLAFDNFYRDSKRTQIVLTNIPIVCLLEKEKTRMIEGQIRQDFTNQCWQLF